MVCQATHCRRRRTKGDRGRRRGRVSWLSENAQDEHLEASLEGGDASDIDGQAGRPNEPEQNESKHSELDVGRWTFDFDASP